MSFWEPCWACRLLAGERCGEIVRITEDVFVAINPFASNPGHSLVMPRLHVPDIFSLPDDLAAAVMMEAARVSRAAIQAFAADGITLRQNNGAASGQHLFHFHLHVIPRFTGDAERFSFDAPLASAADQKRTAALLRDSLATG